MNEDEEVRLAHDILLRKGFLHTAHRLERESGLFFDRQYVRSVVLQGKFLKAIRYLEGFVLPPHNVEASHTSKQRAEAETSISSPVEQCTLKIFHDLHLQRYLEAIFHHDRYEAFKILQSDLRYMLQNSNFVHYQSLVDLLSSDQLPDAVVKNFVSSRDPIHWKPSATEHFIPQLFSLFDLHPKLKNECKSPSKAVNVENVPLAISPDPFDPPMPKLDMPRPVITPKVKAIPKEVSVTLSKPRASSTLLEAFKKIEGFSYLSRLSISNGGVLGLLDNRGKITILDLDGHKATTRHGGFYRTNILPMEQMKSHSIGFSKNGAWICSTSGGAASLFQIDMRKNRKAASGFNNVSFIDFVAGDKLLLGLHSGVICCANSNGDLLFYGPVHDGSKILGATALGNFLISICANGVFVLSQVTGQDIKKIFVKRISLGNNTSLVRLHRGKLANVEYVLLCYPNGISLFDILATSMVHTLPPEAGSLFTSAAFSCNGKMVFCTTNIKTLFVFAVTQSLAVVGKEVLNCFGIPVSISCHPVDPKKIYIGTTEGELLLIDVNLPTELLTINQD